MSTTLTIILLIAGIILTPILLRATVLQYRKGNGLAVAFYALTGCIYLFPLCLTHPEFNIILLTVAYTLLIAGAYLLIKRHTETDLDRRIRKARKRENAIRKEDEKGKEKYPFLFRIKKKHLPGMLTPDAEQRLRDILMSRLTDLGMECAKTGAATDAALGRGVTLRLSLTRQEAAILENNLSYSSFKVEKSEEKPCIFRPTDN